MGKNVIISVLRVYVIVKANNSQVVGLHTVIVLLLLQNVENWPVVS